MIDFSKSAENRRRQDSVVVDGVEYQIRTEFFWWIAFGEKVKEEGAAYEDFNCLYKFSCPGNIREGFEELKKFYINGQALPRPVGGKTGVTGFDWLLDSEYIYAAFLQQYRINLLEASPHWHDFQALFNGLTGTKLNEIISVRYDKSKKGPVYETRKAWEIVKPAVKRPVMEMV